MHKGRRSDPVSGPSARISRPLLSVLLITSCLIPLYVLSGHASGEPGETAAREPVNPHFAEDRCGVCHEEGMDTQPLLPRQNELCLSCHRDERVRTDPHPTRIPSHAGPVKKVPRAFPLVLDTLACVTCHDSKVQCLPGDEGKALNPAFLRGGPYDSPYSICFGCHDREAYELFNPHKQVDARGEIVMEDCLYCHEKPASSLGGDDRVDPFREGICTDCHHLGTHPVGSAHMRRVNADTGARIRSIEEEEKLYLPLSRSKEIACATCHNPHDRGVFPAGDVRALGAETPPAARHRVRVEGGVICLLCHRRGNE